MRRTPRDGVDRADRMRLKLGINKSIADSTSRAEEDSGSHPDGGTSSSSQSAGQKAKKKPKKKKGERLKKNQGYSEAESKGPEVVEDISAQAPRLDAVEGKEVIFCAKDPKVGTAQDTPIANPTEVGALSFSDEHPEMKAAQDEEAQSPSEVVTVGPTAAQAPRIPQAPRLDAVEGKGVIFCAKDPKVDTAQDTPIADPTEVVARDEEAESPSEVVTVGPTAAQAPRVPQAPRLDAVEGKGVIFCAKDPKVETAQDTPIADPTEVGALNEEAESPSEAITVGPTAAEAGSKGSRVDRESVQGSTVIPNTKRAMPSYAEVLRMKVQEQQSQSKVKGEMLKKTTNLKHDQDRQRQSKIKDEMLKKTTNMKHDQDRQRQEQLLPESVEGSTVIPNTKDAVPSYSDVIRMKIREEQRQREVKEEMEKQAAKLKLDQETKLAELLLDFLPGCIHPRQVEDMIKNGSFILSVNFMDLLKEKRLKDLAIKIAENTNHNWLNGTAATFLHQNGMGSEDLSELKVKTTISFTNVPKSFKSLKKLLKSGPRWKRTRDGKFPLTGLGRRPFVGLIDAVLEKHVQGLSYNGQLTIEDLVMIGSSHCLIYAEPQEAVSNDSYKADFSCIWEIMAPFYQFWYNGTMHYPLNMSYLEYTLTLVEAGKMTTLAYRKIVRYNPVLAPSKARQVFIVDFRREVRGLKDLQENGFLSVIPSNKIHWTQWSRREPAFDGDWRTDFAKSTCPVLNGVFNFDPEKGKVTSAAPSNNAQGTRTDSSTASASSFNNSIGFKRFKNTVWGMVNYDRCLVEHGKEHGESPDGLHKDEHEEGRFIVDDHTSIEIHAFAYLHGLMMYLLSTMLDNGMFSLSRFAVIWDTYVALFDAVKLDDHE